MYLTESQIELMQMSRDSLKKIEERKSIPSVSEKLLETLKGYDKGKNFFEEYDEVTFEGKLKIDLMYYEQLTKNMDEELSETCNSAIHDLYVKANRIYEFINIKPELYGTGVSHELLNESELVANQRITKIIKDYYNKNYYRLDESTKIARYFDKQKALSEQLIETGVAPEDAIAHCIKSVVTEDLVRNICFPFAPWSRIKYLTDDHDYSVVFDQDKLIDLVDDFNNSVQIVSRIIATSV